MTFNHILKDRTPITPPLATGGCPALGFSGLFFSQKHASVSWPALEPRCIHTQHQSFLESLGG